MEQNWDDFDLEEIHFRDKWQFELKSHYMPSAKLSRHIYTQELYLYVPAALQVNVTSYSKQQFYQDQTNLIRYKTPEFTFQQIIDPDQKKSPIYRIKQLLNHPSPSPLNGSNGQVEKELKILGNIVRSALRREAHSLISILQSLEPNDDKTPFEQPATTFLIHLNIFFTQFDEMGQLIEKTGNTSYSQVHIYVADFISFCTNYYLSALLDKVRKNPSNNFHKIDEQLSSMLIREKKWREKWLDEPATLDNSTTQNETILYQIGLLNKYVIDALLLNVSVDPIDQHFRNVIGGISAAIAMSLYILLFVWQGSVFVINSLPFILFTIFIYVLKDRLKDEIKNMSMQQAFRWFSDYKTEIRTPDNKMVIGELRESFTFLDLNKIPEEIEKVRNIEQHKTLQSIRRQEQVMFYKKNVRLNNIPETKQDRFSGLNVIFRLDIHKFLNKASDSVQPFTTVNPETGELIHTMLPKVYHLNLVLKNSYLKADNTFKTEIKKYRIIANKEGILRVENISDIE